MATIDETIPSASGWKRQWVMPPGWALIRRDFVGELRQRRSFYLLLIVVASCIALVSLMWPWDNVPIQYVGNQSREMFGFFALLHLIAAGVLPPGLAALAFVSERRQDTLDQLRLSLISTWGLVAAKLLSSVGIVGLLFVGTLPALGVQLLLVGVSLGEVIGLIVVVLTTAFMGASIGLTCAVKFRRPLVAIVMSYIGTLMAMGGFLFLIWLPLVILYFALGQANSERLARAVFEAIGEPNIESLAMFLFSALFGPYEALWSSTGFTADNVLTAGGYRLAVGALFVVMAARILRRPPKPLRVPKERPIDDPEVLRKRRHSFPYYLIDPLRRHPLIPDHANPIFARELRYGLGLRAHWVSRIFLATALVFGLAGFAVAWPSGSYSYAWDLHFAMVWAMGLTTLIVAVLVANTLTKEREQESLGLLRMTLLSPREILVGKLWAAIATTGPLLGGLLVAAIPVLILAAMIDYYAFYTVILGFATLLTCVWFTLCLALCVGAFARTTAVSLTAGVLLNAAVYFGPLLLALVLQYMPYDTSVTYPWMHWTFHLSPITAYGFKESKLSEPHIYPDNLAVGGGFYAVLPIFVLAGCVLLWVAYCRLEALNQQDE